MWSYLIFIPLPRHATPLPLTHVCQIYDPNNFLCDFSSARVKQLEKENLELQRQLENSKGREDILLQAIQSMSTSQVRPNFQKLMKHESDVGSSKQWHVSPFTRDGRKTLFLFSGCISKIQLFLKCFLRRILHIQICGGHFVIESTGKWMQFYLRIGWMTVGMGRMLLFFSPPRPPRHEAQRKSV